MNSGYFIVMLLATYNDYHLVKTYCLQPNGDYVRKKTIALHMVGHTHSNILCNENEK